MSRVCELTGKRVGTGMNVSHSHIRTKRRFKPNLQTVRLWSDALGQKVRFRIASALRSVDHNEGLDRFLLKADDRQLSPRARRIKALIRARLDAASAN